MMVMADLAPVEAPEGAVADFTFALRDNADPLRSYDAADRFQLLGAQVWLDRPTQTMPVERVELWGTGGIRWTAALPLARLEDTLLGPHALLLLRKKPRRLSLPQALLLRLRLLLLAPLRFGLRHADLFCARRGLGYG
jgi:hypothetical protein